MRDWLPLPNELLELRLDEAPLPTDCEVREVLAWLRLVELLRLTEGEPLVPRSTFSSRLVLRLLDGVAGPEAEEGRPLPTRSEVPTGAR